MADYKSRLPDSRPHQGIEVALYDVDGNRVDVQVTNEDGAFTFYNVSPGQYELRFFGGDYNEADWRTINVLDPSTFAGRYFIRPLDGTAIKNSSGELRFEIVAFQGSDQQVLTSGDVKFYRRLQNGDYERIQTTDTGVVSSTSDYEITINQDYIDGSATLFAGEPTGSGGFNEYDSVTAVDVRDGKGFNGWVETTSYIAVYDPDTASYSPSTITMTPKFAIEGSIVDPSIDSNFSFTSLPANDSGLTINSTTGEITIDVGSYFDSNTQFTPTWQAEYTSGGATYITSVSETVYEAPASSDAKMIQVLPSSQAFKANQYGTIQSPSEIEISTNIQNISTLPTWSVVDTDGTVTLTDNSDVAITEDSQQIDTAYINSGDFNATYAKIRAYTGSQSSPDFYDEVTIVKVNAGSDAFTVLMTNENHTFPADNSGTVLDYSSSSSSAVVYRGATQFSYDGTLASDGTFRFSAVSESPTGAITPTIDDAGGEVDVSNFGESYDRATVTATVEVKFGGGQTRTFNREISYSKAKTGAAGSDAELLRIKNADQTFIKKKDGTKTPSSITLEAIKVNYSETVTWTRVSDSTQLGTGDTISISNSEVTEASPSVTIRASTPNGLTDEITLVLLREGSDAITAFLTNESHTVPADSDGSNANLGGGVSTTLKIYQGAQEVTYSNWSFSTAVLTAAPDPTYSMSGNTLTVTGLPDEDDIEIIEITGSNSDPGIDDVVKEFTITKSLQGNEGAPGQDAISLMLKADSQVFRFDGSSGTEQPDPTNQTITFTAELENLTTTLQWSAVNQDGTDVSADLSGTGDTRTLDVTDFGSAESYSVTVTDGSTRTDTVTVYRLASGEDSKDISLSADTQVFTYDGSSGTDEPSPSGQSIQFTATKTNISDSFSWSSGATLTNPSANNNQRTLTIDNFGSRDSATVTVSAGSLSDSFSVYRLSSGETGESSITGFLTNEAEVLQANPDGSLLSGEINEATGTFKVFDGLTDVTGGANTTYSIPSQPSGASVSIDSAGVYSLDSIDNATKSVSVDLQADYVKDGQTITVTKTFSIAKSLAGDDPITGFLTNESHIVQADEDGAVTPAERDEASGQFKVFDGLTDVTTAGTFDYSVQSSSSGITVSIDTLTDANPGQYRLTSIDQTTSVKSGTAILRAQGTVDGTLVTIDKTFTIAKSIAGSTAYGSTVSQANVGVSKLPSGAVVPFQKSLTAFVTKGGNDISSDYVVASGVSASGISITDGDGNTLSDSVLNPTIDTSASEPTIDVNVTKNGFITDIANLNFIVRDDTGSGHPNFKHQIQFTAQQSGTQGPGLTYIGRYSEVAPADRPINNGDGARDVVQANDGGTDYFYGWNGAHETEYQNTSDPTTNYTTDLTANPDADWIRFENFEAIATRMLIAEDSWIESTVNIGSKGDNIDSAQINIFGSNNNPYLSVGQSNVGYDNEGI